MSNSGRRLDPAGRSPPAAAEALEGRRLLSLPPGFAAASIPGVLNNPTGMAVAPDGRVFVALQNGNVRVVKDDVLLPDSFVNVREDSQEERGLLGITFDPDFPANHFVYLYYTRKDAAPLVAHNDVSRFVADGDVAAGGVNAGGEQVLLELPDVGAAIWHMGGGLHFGPDGKLYVAVGDHMRSDQAQSLASPFGKILRINPDGTIPADNPFYDQASGINKAIWALGLRNPFSSAFQPGTGRFFINDVGGGRAEEVDEGAAGRNFGWPATEGAFDAATFPAFTNPLYSYRHGSDAACVVGGAFYDGVAPHFPAEFRGKYFFADFSRGWVRTLDPRTQAVQDFGADFPYPVALTLGPDGSMWVLSHDATDGGTPNAGFLQKVRYTLAPPPASVAGRQAFYNNSAPDGRDPSATAGDDRAVAPDKAALLPGARATFANVTSYTRGINGVMVDLRGAWGAVSAKDFGFKAGSGASWADAPPPSILTVRPGAGTGGSDRVTLIWPDGAVRNTWLRVTVKANDSTGLAADDVFWFGNLTGETGEAVSAGRLTVNAFDLVATRRRRSARATGLTSAYDFNRDGRVNALDVAAAKANQGKTLALDGPTAPAVPPAAMITAAAARATALVRDDQFFSLARYRRGFKVV